ncbi:PREDICTED: hemogen isoform X3 [Lepidothrix coronata]|uniref:Hemogen isoform X3 n=1 Tax=Lepidothrix coronata TaxID=321398 RepID=A0A6J0HCT7_9PASS|nr:PREDICTED: hemogen isoform X3 [Lepidothrix coronata]
MGLVKNLMRKLLPTSAAPDGCHARLRRESPLPYSQVFTRVKPPGRVHKNQQQKRGRGAKRGRGRQPEVKATLDPEPTTDPQPELHEEAEPVHSEPALPEPVHSEPALPEPVHSEPALPEPVYQEQLPMLTVHNPVSGMQPVAVEGEPAARSLDPAGEEEVVKPTEAEILEDFNTPLENDHQDNEFNTHVLY